MKSNSNLNMDQKELKPGKKWVLFAKHLVGVGKIEAPSIVRKRIQKIKAQPKRAP